MGGLMAALKMLPVQIETKGSHSLRKGEGQFSVRLLNENCRP
jgi:hypothetical protein